MRHLRDKEYGFTNSSYNKEKDTTSKSWTIEKSLSQDTLNHTTFNVPFWNVYKKAQSCKKLTCVLLISLSLGDQITTTLATSVLPVSSEQNS